MNHLLLMTFRSWRGGVCFKSILVYPRPINLIFRRRKEISSHEYFKTIGRKPDRIWDSLVEDSVQSTEERRAPKKKEGGVGSWDDGAQWALMHELVPHRLKLRTQRYSVDVWEIVSQKMQTSHNLHEVYTPDQIAEKVRLMKRTLRDVKNGKRKTEWPFTEVMIHIFEKPIEEDEDEGDFTFSVGSFNSYLNGMPAGANSSSISAEQRVFGQS
ncbi:uncharacterized protein LOC117640744 [Thrips palmi]|uniref:Uncharacterized protein LOC117640744 n=1 Tax=Thrips palmi TaxID=161013 RepID=A0A6P8YHT5_THRPL|nr:uncharacterized protein LOC117640744 [Thrips palmi]